MIEIREFRGFRPGLHPYNQRSEYSSKAGNLWLTSGEFRPLQDLLRLDYQPETPRFPFDTIQVIRRNDGSYDYMHVDSYSVAESYYTADDRELVFANASMGNPIDPDLGTALAVSLQGQYTDADTYGGNLLSQYISPRVIGLAFRPEAGVAVEVPPQGERIDNTVLLATILTRDGFETSPTLATRVFSFDYTDSIRAFVNVSDKMTNIKSIRIYMEIEGQARLIHEEPINLAFPAQGGNIVGTNLDGENILGTAFFTLDPADAEGELLTLDADGPANVKNMINASNGRLAGVSWNNRTVHMSDQGNPISWPIEIPIDRRIVRIIRSGEEVLVLTDGRPSVITGYETPYEQQIPFAEPCIAPESVVDMGFAILYVSYSGICAIQNYSGTVLTMDNRHDGGSEVINTREWQQLELTSIKASSYQGRYIFYFRQGGLWKGYAYNVRYSELMELPDIQADDIYLVKNPDSSTGNESLEVFTEISGTLTRHQFNAGSRLTGYWEREFEIKEHEPLVYLRVCAEDYNNCRFRVNSGDWIDITDDGIFAIDSTFRDRKATFRIESSAIIQSFRIAHRAEDLY